MAKGSVDKSVWQIFFEGLKIYCLNFHKFFLYMAFPVLGQVVGLFLIFGLTFWYSSNLPQLILKYSILNDFSMIALSIIVVVLPGLILFTKAFWNYLVAYGALNSMADAALSTGKVYDFPAHNATVKQHLLVFVGVWFLLSVFTMVAIIPFFWLLWIFFIYFILVFQVYTFEQNLLPVSCFRRSFQLIKGKFGRTFLLMMILTVATYYLVTMALSVIADAIKLSDVLLKIFENWSMNLPLEYLNKFYEATSGITLTPLMLAKSFVTQFFMFIAVGFTLPLRSICWTLWYKNNDTEGLSSVVRKVKSKKETDRSKKKVKKSSITIEKRGIDPEIIRRARLEDDEY